MLHNRQSDERGSLKWQLQPVKVLFSTFYTWGMSTRTRLVYALKVVNSWHVHTLPSRLTQPVSAQRKELSLGKELQSLENVSSRIFCIGSWIHFLYWNRTGFKKIAVDLQRALKVISRYMKLNTWFRFTPKWHAHVHSPEGKWPHVASTISWGNGS